MWPLAPWWHWLAMLLFWVVLVGGAIWVVDRLFPAPSPPKPDPRSLLDARLARGEIDVGEYRRLRDLLRG